MFRLRQAYWPWVAFAAVLLTAVVLLRAEGRSWWCACGQAFLWTSEADGPHTSQHLLDPYSLTHVLHGVLLCGLIAWA
jgi:hypothetical protein